MLLNQRSELESVWNEAFEGVVADVEYASKQYTAKVYTEECDDRKKEIPMEPMISLYSAIV